MGDQSLVLCALILTNLERLKCLAGVITIINNIVVVVVLVVVVVVIVVVVVVVVFSSNPKIIRIL